MTIFKDRHAAGEILAEHLQIYDGRPETIILGIPRGGVVVAAQVAKKLNLPLDMIITRKIGAPGREELALGAINPDGKVIWDEQLLGDLGLKADDLENKVAEQLKEIQRRELLYRQNKAPRANSPRFLSENAFFRHLHPWTESPRFSIDENKPPLDVKGKTVILIDDGIATGATCLSAVNFIRSLGAKKIVVAAPVGATESIKKISPEVDEIIVPYPQEYLGAVGTYYQNFEPVLDEEVIELLSSHQKI